VAVRDRGVVAYRQTKTSKEATRQTNEAAWIGKFLTPILTPHRDPHERVMLVVTGVGTIGFVDNLVWCEGCPTA